MIIPPLLSQVVSPTSVNIKLNSSTFAISDSINYLGILIYSKLLFRDHTHKVQNKLSRAVVILYKLKNHFLLVFSKNFTLPYLIRTYFTVL